MDALIHHLEEKQDLSPREVQVAVALLLDPAAADAKKERLLEALALKGETPAEIAKAAFKTGKTVRQVATERQVLPADKLNDLLDLTADRHHPRKRHRPFASGDLAPSAGFWLVPTLLVGAGALTVLLPRAFGLALMVYLAGTLAYSFRSLSVCTQR